ncbi:hypothetical protein NW761_012437 [Fusarium oxysporum]|uniref:Heterokaryon incompatibility protein 6, OR allele n=1 Tax=Fusarium oxysporum f. sp. pisi HDV247 TaxID=1080344 RepID=W9NMF6_FUSOX|nr:hypothetical protein FOVG_16786 [Fusarium oxysporum f. sp. pisi HDV247]KAJ4035401.1 hypothetical protein NW758_010435 [Fusarium oxysporum]WKT40148.1 hypothetical protein QSH57_001967 [Fusarium oxysporum f. sp. vasinfectum]KAJ4059300.1 hypothetical protein NW763_006733 [Fusarium oxysporum]KAJ4062599.1 hypothetical protein NW753_004069 [Fusarium oxysporum]
MKPEWRVQEAGHVIPRGLQIAVIEATAPGYPSIIPGSTLGGKTVINEWRRLADLFAYPDASPTEKPSGNERERAFENALSGGFTYVKWPKGSLEYIKAYRAWSNDFDELIRQTSERRRFIVTSDGQVGFGPEGAEKGDVVVIIPGGKVLYVLRRVEDSDCGVKRYRLLGDAFINDAMAGEKVDPSTSELTKIVIV